MLWSNGTTTQQVASVGSRTTSVKISRLQAGTTNSFAVTAYNSTSSATSAWTSVTLPAAIAVSAPQGLSFTLSTGSTGTLSWTGSAGATGYMVYAVDAGSQRQASAWVDAGSTSITVSGLRPGRSYLFRVVAANDDGSAASDWLTTLLPAAASSSGATTAVGRCGAFAALASRRS